MVWTSFAVAVVGVTVVLLAIGRREVYNESACPTFEHGILFISHDEISGMDTSNVCGSFSIG